MQNHHYPTKALTVLAILQALAVASLIYFTITGCTSTKDLNKVRTVVDSSVIKEQSDSIRTLKAERDRFEEMYNEMMFSGVIFSTDSFLIRDTIRVPNSVTIKPDGTIEAKGKISSAFVSKTVFSKIIAQKDRTIDSFRLVKQKQVDHYYKVTETKTVHKKTKVLNFWWLAIICFVAGWFVKGKVGTLQLFNKKITI